MGLQHHYDEEQEEFSPEPSDAGKETADADVRQALVLKILKQVHEGVGHAISVLEGGEGNDGQRTLAALVTAKQELVRHADEMSGARVLEGVFDGASMVGPDGKTYSVPPNYASKSRLVEGDVLKLTIKPDGSFVYKQIAPVERRRAVGNLAFDGSTNSYVALADGQTYKLLTASVTFFKGSPGDEVVLLLPKSGKAAWASVENIMRK